MHFGHMTGHKLFDQQVPISLKLVLLDIQSQLFIDRNILIGTCIYPFIWHNDL